MAADSAWREAARYGDADAEEHGLEACIAKQGIDFAEFSHVADQRALRNVIMRRPGFNPASLDHALAVRLDPLELAAHAAFVPAYYDGLYIGWRARGLVEACLPADDAADVAEALRTLAELDGGENTDHDRLLALAERIAPAQA